jgi:peptidoglycan/LPS O-acetylase OafA/YrhL
MSASEAVKVQRYAALDGLRGVAALLVVFSHFLNVRPGGWDRVYGTAPVRGSADPYFWLLKTPLNLLVSGPQAVLVFFVLSGFVLALTFEQSDRGNYLPYIIKRVWRIWPPFAFGIMVGALLVWTLRPEPVVGLSVWFNTWVWPRSVTLGQAAVQLLMLKEGPSLDPPAWSLLHEMRFSVLLPLIYWATVRRKTVTFLGLLTFSIVAGVLVNRTHNGWIQTFGDTAHYIYLFAAGVLIYVNAGTIKAALNRSPVLRAVLWAIVAVLFTTECAFDPLIYHNGSGLVVGVASMGLVCLCLTDGAANRILTSTPARWLGEVSYSLYLIHLPITLALLHVWGSRVPVSLLLTGALGLSLLAAAAMNR